LEIGLVQIYQHLSYRTVLADWFQYKKSTNSRFSYRMVSRLFRSKSPSFLKDVIKGSKNLNEEQQQRCIDIMELKGDEEEYLKQLFLLEHSTSDEVRHRAMEKISAIRRINGTVTIEGESYRYLTRWYCPAIREMSLQPNFRCDPDWIVSQIRPIITREEAVEALQILQDLKMLTIESPTTFATSEGSFSTPMQVQGLAVHNYHEQMLHLAHKSVTSFREKDRHLLGCTVSINKELIPALKKELNGMIARILDVCEGDEKPKDHTIQVGLHFFPLCTIDEQKKE